MRGGVLMVSKLAVRNHLLKQGGENWAIDHACTPCLSMSQIVGAVACMFPLQQHCRHPSCKGPAGTCGTQQLQDPTVQQTPPRLT